MDELRYVEKKPNDFMYKELFKDIIQDVDYTFILDGIENMETSDRIDQVKA